MMLVSCLVPLHTTISDRTTHFHPVSVHRKFHSAAQASSLLSFRDQCRVLPYRAGLEPRFATSAFHHGLLLCSPSISFSALLWRPVLAHGHWECLNAKVPVEGEDAGIAQTTIQRLVFLPWVECPGQEGVGKVGMKVLGWTDPEQL